MTRRILLGCLTVLCTCGQALAQAGGYTVAPGHMGGPAQIHTAPADPNLGYPPVPAPAYSPGRSQAPYYQAAPQPQAPAGSVYSPPSTASPAGVQAAQPVSPGYPGGQIQGQGRSQVELHAPTDVYMDYQDQRYRVPARRLYADPIETFDTFDHFVPRKHAFAAQGMNGPDPGIHSTLPALKRASSAPATRPTAAPRASVQPSKPTTTQTTQSAPKAQTPVPAATTPQAPQTSQAAPSQNTATTPTAATTPAAPTTPTTPASATTPGTAATGTAASNGQAAAPTPTAPTPPQAAPTAPPVVQSAQPVMPAFTPQPRGTTLQ